jgi:hypothetical protein
MKKGEELAEIARIGLKCFVSPAPFMRKMCKPPALRIGKVAAEWQADGGVRLARWAACH